MPPDFGREVHCLLGLVFDAVDMEQAEQRLLRAVTHGERCFLSTPNLNFLIACRKDDAFRNSVLKSDLSVADGMPLIWLSRVLGIPIRQRVAGSDLFDRIAKSSRAVRIFFFGGMAGVAGQACQRLNASGLPAVCVGFDSPGFGSISDMSSEAVIATINASDADFVVVALGAKKGQEWIEHNRHRLDAPLISHLGAVVNFAAGTVGRAPAMLRRLGLEWLWRIKEEPLLWRRYLSDGWVFLELLLTRVLPLLWFRFTGRPSVAQLASARVKARHEGSNLIIRMEGAWTMANLPDLRRCFAEAVQTQGDTMLDMENVNHIDSAVLGLLLLLYGYQSGRGRRVMIVSASREVRRTVRYSEVEYLLGDQ